MAHKSARPRVAGAQQHRTHNSCSKGFRDLEDQVQFALEVQDSLATVVMPVLAKGRRGSRGQDRAAGEPPPKEKTRTRRPCTHQWARRPARPPYCLLPISLVHWDNSKEVLVGRGRGM